MEKLFGYLIAKVTIVLKCETQSEQETEGSIQFLKLAQDTWNSVLKRERERDVSFS